MDPNYTPQEGDPQINNDLDNSLEEPTISISDDASPSLSSSPVEETPASEPAPGPAEEQTASTTTTSEEPPAEPPAATWEPDFKYKVRDEEHEMDAWVKDNIKDEETFKKVQDLYTRGHGLEIAKQERDEFKQKYTDLEQGINHVASIANQYYQDPTNPVHSRQVAEKFIKELGLPKQLFLQYAIEELKYQQLPPEQRANIDAERQQQAQIAQYQQQAQTLEQTNQNMQVAHYNQMLDMKLADPGIQSAITEYETKVGKPGSFKEFVIQRGIFHEQVNNQIVEPGKVVDEVVAMLGITPGGTQTQTPQAGTQSVQTPQQQTTQQMQSQRQKPVLPNISGQGSASPVKQGYTSIEQIREKYNQLASQ
jgi:hypothetical protein